MVNNEPNKRVFSCFRTVEKAKKTLDQPSRHDSQKLTEKPGCLTS